VSKRGSHISEKKERMMKRALVLGLSVFCLTVFINGTVSAKSNDKEMKKVDISNKILKYVDSSSRGDSNDDNEMTGYTGGHRSRRTTVPNSERGDGEGLTGYTGGASSQERKGSIRERGEEEHGETGHTGGRSDGTEEN
jgi:hypothetical protein